MNARAALVVSLLSSSLALAAGEPSGWKFDAGTKGKPAILLIHGLAASRTHWTSPADTWSIKNGHYLADWKPKDQKGSSTIPVIKGGVRSFVLSKVNKNADEDGSFWKRLKAEGFTVATWNQIPCMDTSSTPSDDCLNSDVFDKAYPTAKEALAYLATKTDEDIILIGHSRGGLIARKLLKESDADLPALQRVKMLITLHTPHKGSSMAQKGNEVQKKLKNPQNAIDLDWVPKEVRKVAKDLMPDVGKKLSGVIDVLVVLTGLKGAKELDGNGPIIKGIENGEKKRAGVKYYTFGGDDPRVARIFARVYTDGGQDWKTEGKTVLDFPADLKVPFPEMKKGGDLLVTDASSHFAFEDQHWTYDLNHASVLWSKRVKNKVVGLLNAQVVEDAEGEASDDSDDQADDVVAK